MGLLTGGYGSYDPNGMLAFDAVARFYREAGIQVTVRRQPDMMATRVSMSAGADMLDYLVSDTELAHGDPNTVWTNVLAQMAHQLERQMATKKPKTLKGGLRQAVGSIKANANLIIMPRLEDYFLYRSHEPLPEEHAETLKRLVTATPRNRTGSFSPSGLYQCERRQVFRYLGVHEAGIVDTKLTNLFSDGDWRHLRLQMALLHAGIIDAPEVPMAKPELRLRGTRDGHGPIPGTEGRKFTLEVKGANERSFGFIINAAKPTDEHLLQGAGYAIGSGIYMTAFLYECKNTQRLKEFDVDYTTGEYQPYMEMARGILERLNEAVDTRTLPNALAEDANECKKCPFRKVCREVDYDQAEAMGKPKSTRKVRLKKKPAQTPTEAASVREENLPYAVLQKRKGNL